MAKPPSKQKLLYQQAWLKAFRQPDGLKLFFDSESGMYEARKNLYDAVKVAKANPLEYGDLARAAEALQIVLLRDGRTGLHMRHRNLNDATKGVEAALGLSVDEMEDPEAMESLQRILKGSGKVAVDSDKLLNELGEPLAHKPNPFFDRTKD